MFRIIIVCYIQTIYKCNNDQKKGATMIDRTLLKVNEMKKSMDPQQYDADDSES